MIHNFPIPYADELFYSLVARREAQMGYPSYKGVLLDVFGCTGTMVAFEFPSRLQHLIAELPPSHPCADFKRLEQLTLLPWHVPFLPKERCDRIRAAMMGSGGRDCWNWAGITAARVKSPTLLRYCPDCLREDAASGRTPYWRRLHQMAGIEVCPKHEVFLENSEIHRLRHRYRYFVPATSLLDTRARKVKSRYDPAIGLARLGQELLSREWPELTLDQLRRNYVLQLDRMGYVNGRGEVKMDALLLDLNSLYTRGFLEKLGCRGQHWVVRMLRSSVSIQQPIRHLLLVNYMGIGLADLFSPKPLPRVAPIPLVSHPSLVCINHLCPQQNDATCEFIYEERSSMLGGIIETYQCKACGQVRGRCCVGHERTWVRDYGRLWRDRLTELWKDPELGLRAIASALRVSCDAARKGALKLGLPLTRPGRRCLSVRSYPHLLVSKSEKRRLKVEALRKQWQETKESHPELGTRGLRGKLPAIYATLYRYDREWLTAHLPPRKSRPLSVDWDERDRALCRDLKTAVARLNEVTPCRLARAVGLKGWLRDRLSRLPRARQTLLRLTQHGRSKPAPSSLVLSE